MKKTNKETMIKSIFSLSAALSLIVFAGCGESDSKSGGKADKDKSAESKELKAANKIAGEYTGKADVNWGILSEGIIFGEEEIADLKISIAHSGDDNNKQLLFRVEKTAPAVAEEDTDKAEQSDGEDANPDFFCVVLKNFSIKESGQTVEFLAEGANKVSKGEIQDVSTLSLVKLEGEELQLKVDKKGSKDPLSAEDVTNLSKTGSAPSFQDLYLSCELV